MSHIFSSDFTCSIKSLEQPFLHELVQKSRNFHKNCNPLKVFLMYTCAIASPLRLRATQVIGPLSDNWAEIMSSVWQPDSLTMILCRLSSHNLWPWRYQWMSGGGRPPTRHCTLRESFSITSRSRSEVRKRGISAWSSGSITPLVGCDVLVDFYN